jgi:hypothetical protein
MAYSVLQKDLEPPSSDQLKNAFRGVPGLTAYDAVVMCKHCFGILVKDFELAQANALQQGLAGQGVEAEVVDEATLPRLPETFFIHQVDCKPDMLLVYDQLGRVAEVKWEDIHLIAAGRVVLAEFKEVRTGGGGSRLMGSVASQAGYGGVHVGTGHVDYSLREEDKDRLLIEIVLRGNATRYSINADKSAPLLFQYLGPRRAERLQPNFALVVQDLLNGAKEAAINRGAYYFRENSDRPFIYPSKTAFLDEMIWLLWRASLNEA